MPETKHVYVVEAWWGEFSEYAHTTAGVFSSYEKAVEWIENHEKEVLVSFPFAPTNMDRYTHWNSYEKRWEAYEVRHPVKRDYEEGHWGYKAIWEYPCVCVNDEPSYGITEMEVA